MFTPYCKGCLNAPRREKSRRQPKLLTFYPTSEQINKPNDLNLLPKTPLGHPDDVFLDNWENQLDTFLDKKLSGYKEGRNFPEHDQTSKLSPHFTFRRISPNQIWYKSHRTRKFSDTIPIWTASIRTRMENSPIHFIFL